MSYTYHRFLLISFPSVATILEIFHLLLVGCLCYLRHYPYVCWLSLLHKGVGWLMTTHCDFDFQFRLMNYWRRRLLTLDGLWHFRAYSDLEFYHCFDLLEVRTWIALAPGGWHLGLGCEAVRPSKIFTFSKLGMGFLLIVCVNDPFDSSQSYIQLRDRESELSFNPILQSLFDHFAKAGCSSLPICCSLIILSAISGFR